MLIFDTTVYDVLSASDYCMCATAHPHSLVLIAWEFTDYQQIPQSIVEWEINLALCISPSKRLIHYPSLYDKNVTFLGYNLYKVSF